MTVIVLNAWQIFFRGGPMMWPILLLSIVAVTIGINRFMAMGALERRMKLDKKLLIESLQQGKLKDTVRLCDEQSRVLSKILKAGIIHFGASRDLMKAAMEEEVELRAAQLKEQMQILTFIINAAPLLGLLGTINAMAVVFHAVQVRSNVLSPLTAGELASGIWQALLTTSAGLVVAILSYGIYTICSMRINAALNFIGFFVLETTTILQQLAQLKKASTEQGHED